MTLLRGVHGVEASCVADHKKIEGKLDELAVMVRTLADSKKTATLCGICASTDHPTEACSTLKETGTLDLEQPQAYAANIYGNNRQHQQQYNHDLSTNRYNPGWKEHPNLKWGNQQPQHQNQQQTYAPPHQRQRPQPTATSGDSNMETMMKMMADLMKGQINELKQTMEATNQNLQN